MQNSNSTDGTNADSEQKTEVPTSSPAIGNTTVGSRFFFFAYNFVCDKSFSGNGSCWFGADGMPSHKKIIEVCQEQIEKRFPKKYADINIVILGWQEFTKEDYTSWVLV